MKKIIRYVGTIASAVLVAPLLTAQADPKSDLSISVGAEYTSGDYGTSSTTNIWYVPVTFAYATDVNLVSLTVPYISIEGQGTVVPVGAGGMGAGMGGGGTQAFRRGATRAARTTNSGLGDVVLMGSHEIAETASGRVDLTGKVKFGTADDTNNLGTGEDDYAVQVDLAKAFDSNSIYGSLGYQVLGSPPGINLEDGFYGSLGLAHKLDAVRTVGLEAYAQQAVISGGSEASDLTLYLSNALDKKSKLTAYVLKGLSNGSPDWGLGVVLKVTM